ncbi:MAG: hypothetical protein AB1502_06700, partial [Thermodesulfobacteriota bacterium]
MKTGIQIHMSLVPCIRRAYPGLDPGDNVYRGRDNALVCVTPPSEPDVRISRIRLSGRWYYLTRIGVKLDG